MKEEEEEGASKGKGVKAERPKEQNFRNRNHVQV